MDGQPASSTIARPPAVTDVRLEEHRARAEAARAEAVLVAFQKEIAEQIREQAPGRATAAPVDPPKKRGRSLSRVSFADKDEVNLSLPFGLRAWVTSVSEGAWGEGQFYTSNSNNTHRGN